MRRIVVEGVEKLKVKKPSFAGGGFVPSGMTPSEDILR